MRRLFYLLLLCLLVSSCSNKSKQQSNQQNIVGDWQWVDFERSSDFNDAQTTQRELNISGFAFHKDQTFDTRHGYFRYEGWGKNIYLGRSSKYVITADSLTLFDPESNKWHKYEIKKLTDDLLEFGLNGDFSIYKHVRSKIDRTPKFDKIILSTSSCLGACAISNTIISADGTVIFKGVMNTLKTGLFSGKISKDQYEQLQDNFRRMDFDSLKASYKGGPTDQQTICVTFIKDGKIYKTVHDYGESAPYPFNWAYTPLAYLYQTINLQNIPDPKFIPHFRAITDCKFRQGDLVLDIKQSETFLLFEYLRNGKAVSINFKPRFKIRGYFSFNPTGDIETDGRYYTFITKDKPVTIDIGFNFYDINSKNWHWSKADKYD